MVNYPINLNIQTMLYKVRLAGDIKKLATILHTAYCTSVLHSCLKWPLEEIYNLIFEHLTYSAISVPNWNTLQKYFSLAHYLTEMIKTF